MKKKDMSIIKTISLYFLILLILFGIVTSVLIVIDSIEKYKIGIERFKENTMKRKKELLKNEVKDLINQIKREKGYRENVIKNQIKERVYEAYAILDTLYKKYHRIKDEDQLKAIAIDILRAIRFADGRGYYFIIDINGIAHLFPTQPDLEGKSVLFIKDQETGKSIIGEFIKIVKSEGEGYSVYWWYFLYDKTKKYKKISFVKLFKPYNWIIGTGEYYLGDEEELKKKILSFIKERRYGKNGYFFVLSKEGTMLMHPYRPNEIGKNVLNMKDPDGKYITKEFIKVAKNPDGGFVRYIWQKPEEDRYVEKITYAKLYPDWGWIIGTGMYLDDISEFIEREKHILRTKLIKDIAYIFIGIFLFILFGLYIFSNLSRKLKKSIDTMVSFFKNASDLHKRIDIDKVYFKEFKILAIVTNKLIQEIEENEKRASALLFAIPDLIFVLDRDGCFIEYKGGKEDLYIRPEEFLGKKISDVFPKDLALSMEDAVIRAFETGKIIMLNYKLPFEDAYRFFEARVVKISDKYVLVLVRDMTKERELQRRLDITLRSIGDGVISTDQRGKVIFLNPVAEKLTGWKEGEAKGKDLEEVFYIVSEDTGKRVKSPVEKVIETGKIVGLGNNTLLISKDGTKRVIEDSASPILTEEGELLGIVLVFRDVTDKRKMEEELLKAEKLRAIGVLAGGIAHDFNNILAGVLGYIEILKFHIKDAKSIEKLDKLVSAVLRGKELAHKLLTFSKGSITAKETVNINDIVKNITDFTLSGSDIKVNYIFDKNIWEIEVDKGQIEQVIQNIVLNAKEAINRGGIIEIRTENIEIGEESGSSIAPGKYVRIDIKDNGSGIPKEYLDKIFDPFFSTKKLGSGLGLAISYSIMKQHNGYITVKSKEGEGSLFSIFFPKTENKEPKEGISMENDSNDMKSELQNYRVLIMDDEDDIREILREELKILGYEVEEAKTGEEAIEKYELSLKDNKPFDIVILDLTVPGYMGGKEAARKIKKINEDVIIIVSSGYSKDEILTNEGGFEFDGILKKPYTLEELKNLLTGLLK